MQKQINSRLESGLNKNTIYSRANAARILAIVIKDKKSLTDAAGIIDANDPFVQVLCYGVLRFYFKLEFFLSELTSHAIKDVEIKALLLVGLYQLFYLDKPDHAVVTETVNATRQLKKNWATKLVNGVLRNASRVRAELEKKSTQDSSANFSHPSWLIDLIQKNYSHDWREILEHNNQHPPLTLRVNGQRVSREMYLEKLRGEDIEANETTFSHDGIVLKKALPVSQIPNFYEGFVSVQDEAAQLAAPLLDLSDGDIVLDACAAPGGKTTHLLELVRNINLVAVDVDNNRIKKIVENVQRLNLSAPKVITADVKTLTSHFNNKYFDRILLDVPCSATGVIRRHPDIKLLRKKSDIPKLAGEQLQILNSVWPLLRPNGILLYTTCSILAEENSDVIQKFLQITPGAVEIPIKAGWGRVMLHGRQILPGEFNMDGFYFCQIKKNKDSV